MMSINSCLSVIAQLLWKRYAYEVSVMPCRVWTGDDGSSHLVVVAGTEVDHDMFVSVEKHD